MDREIINAVASRLREEFGEGLLIVSDAVRQGMKEPCFYILCLSGSRKPYPSARYESRTLLDIHYFSASDALEKLEVAARLYELMEVVGSPGGLWRGTGMRHEMIDGVLHFFVSYTAFLLRGKEKQEMEELSLEEGIR